MHLPLAVEIDDVDADTKRHAFAEITRKSRALSGVQLLTLLALICVLTTMVVGTILIVTLMQIFTAGH